jgi:hypothetical protein
VIIRPLGALAAEACPDGMIWSRRQGACVTNTLDPARAARAARTSSPPPSSTLVQVGPPAPGADAPAPCAIAGVSCRTAGLVGAVAIVGYFVFLR